MVKAMEAIAGRMLKDIGDDHRTGLQLQAEVNRLRMRAEALDNANARRSPLDTPAAHAIKIAKMARMDRAELGKRIWRTTSAVARRA